MIATIGYANTVILEDNELITSNFANCHTNKSCIKISLYLGTYIKKVLQFWSQVDRHADSVFLNAKIEDF